MKIRDKNIVLTGGAGGLGRELALHCVKKGATVCIVDVNEVGMQKTAELAGENKGRLFFYKVDIAAKDQVAAFADQVIAQHGHMDAIINNAGIIQPFLRVNDLDYEKIERIININFYGTLYMVKSFLPHLLQRPEAHIINISSMGGFLPVPGQTFYGASKAAVKLLTEGLYAELLGTRVKVTIVFPGAMNTDITKNSGVQRSLDSNKASQMQKILQPDKAAELMIDGIEKDKWRIYLGKDSKMTDLLYRLAPKKTIHLISKKMEALLA